MEQRFLPSSTQSAPNLAVHSSTHQVNSSWEAIYTCLPKERFNLWEEVSNSTSMSILTKNPLEIHPPISDSSCALKIFPQPPISKSAYQGRKMEVWSQAAKGHGRSVGLEAATDLNSRSSVLGGDRGSSIENVMNKRQDEEEATLLLGRPLLTRRHGAQESLEFGSVFLILLFACDLFFMIRLYIFCWLFLLL
ncbi:unnamed protein product [Cuscuta epithymum]|uniref:Uncharacterized protein n=2 Tax=Cuscuta epithymum TaxID=186058 RepID=A0AAV0FWV1_9ASTE|nr:unnamed protein product [Cuscuta epithymum]